MKNDADPNVTLPASVDYRRDQPSRDIVESPRVSIPVPPPAPTIAEVPVPGMVLGGKYRIERVLGKGGIAVVAAAYHLQLRRRVAIKYLLIEALEYPEIVERFTREARAAARIRGEHVARVIDVGCFDGGAPYIVLEYLDGEDLDAHVTKNGSLRISEAVRYILQACEALAEAHAAKIVHRDLKPANLFLCKGPDHRKMIKVLDFGVSKIVDEPMTDPSRMLGTVVYMSPEQLKAAHNVDLRTDIWSLGVILYELLAGVPPFAGQTVVTVARAIERNAPKPLAEVRPEVPPMLEAVVARCMRSNPADRYDSVLDLAVALAPFGASRDRDSVRTIKGVLQGSMAPPPFDSSGSLPIVAEVPTTTAAPPPIASDAPMITSVGPAAKPEVKAAPREVATAASSWLRTPLAGLIAAAIVLGVVLSGVLSIAWRPPSSAKAAVDAPSEVMLRITTAASNAKVRIDDGPLVPLPLEKSVRRDAREHTIYVEAEGYAPRTKVVKFDSDLHLAMGLTIRQKGN